MRKPETIERLYLDFDGFFASVEQQCVNVCAEGRLPAMFLAMVCGEHLTTSTIHRRLRCKECGQRGENKLDVLYGQTDPQGEYFVYRDDTGLMKCQSLWVVWY